MDRMNLAKWAIALFIAACLFPAAAYGADGLSASMDSSSGIGLTVASDSDDETDPQEPISISSATITLSSDAFTYSGKENLPGVTSVIVDGVTLSSADYSVSYKNNVKPGKGTVIVKGQGDYTGTARASFSVYQPAVGYSVHLAKVKKPTWSVFSARRISRA